MTKDQLDAIAARCEAATPGPWVLGMPGEFGTYNANTVFVGDAGVAQVYDIPVNTRLEDMPERYAIGVAVGQFIAHARSDVPALVAEVHRLRAALEKIRDEDCLFCGDAASDACYETARTALGGNGP